MSKIYEFEVTLVDVVPVVKRKVQINSDATFEDLHMLIQISFGWLNSHLYQFEVDGTYIEPPSEDEFFDGGDQQGLNTLEVPLEQLVTKKTTFDYTYDFGDNWEHEVKLVNINTDEKLIFPNCLEGINGCPPEDCGGPGGYDHILSVLANPKSTDYVDIKRWVGDFFDPKAFYLQETNDMIIAFFSQKDRVN